MLRSRQASTRVQEGLAPSDDAKQRTCERVSFETTLIICATACSSAGESFGVRKQWSANASSNWMLSACDAARMAAI